MRLKTLPFITSLFLLFFSLTVNTVLQAQCPAPTALGFTALTPTSANVFWTTGGASNWTVEYGPFGFTQGTGTLVAATNDTVLISGLSQNRTYHFYVRDSCGATSLSTWTGPAAFNGTKVNCDNFDGYSTGIADPQSILIQGWQGAGGDAEISSTQANSSPNSLKIHTSGSSAFSDVIADLGVINSGIHNVKFDVFIPTGNGGYYNFLHNYVAVGTSVWAIEVYMNANGTAEVQMGSNGSGIIGYYNFTPNAWNTIEHVIDFTKDSAYIFVNGEYTNVKWRFSLGSSNFGNQLNAVNFYSAAPGGQTPLEYFDNFCITAPYLNDIGVTTFAQPSSFCGDSTFAIRAAVRNFGDNYKTGFNVSLDITGSGTANLNYLHTGWVAPRSTDTITIAVVNNYAGGTFNLQAYTTLLGDANMLNDTATVTNAVIFPGITVNLGPNHSYCTNSTFSTTLNAQNPGSTYLWSTSATTQTINVNTAGTYWVDVTSMGGCTKRDTVVVTALPLPPTAVNSATICAGDNIQLIASGGASYIWTPTTGLSNPNIANPVATPNSTTTYTVTATGANGCTNSASSTVTVNSRPNISITPKDPTVCLGESIQLLASGGVAYALSPFPIVPPSGDTFTVAPLANTTYRLTGTGPNGCTNKDSTTVFVENIPAKPTITNVNDTLTASVAGSAYIWRLDGVVIPNATSQTFIATQSGVYTASVVTPAGCTNFSDPLTVIVTGINEHSRGFVKVYPTIVDHQATLDMMIYEGGALNIEVYSINGQLMDQINTKVSTGKTILPIDMSSLGSGMYIIRIKLDNLPLSDFKVTKI